MPEGIEPVKLIMFIVNRGDGKLIEEFCTREKIYSHLLLRGRGTADNETVALLGLGERDKDIMILTAAMSRTDDIMKKLSYLLHLEKPGRGIACTVPLSGIASHFNSYYALAGIKEPDAQTTNHSDMSGMEN